MEEENDEIPPILANLKMSRNHSDIPPNYFSDFENRLNLRLQDDKLESKNRMELKINNLKIKHLYVFSAAASVLLLIIFSLWFLSGKSSNPFDYATIMATNVEDAMQRIDPKDADEFLIAAIDETERADLEEMLEESEILALEQSYVYISNSDSLIPVVKNSELPKYENNDPEKKGNLKNSFELEDLDDEIAEDIELDELFNDLDDETLAKLEKSILKPKTENKPKPN
jgi:hypothetical protein